MRFCPYLLGQLHFPFFAFDLLLEGRLSDPKMVNAAKSKRKKMENINMILFFSEFLNICQSNALRASNSTLLL